MSIVTNPLVYLLISYLLRVDMFLFPLLVYKKHYPPSLTDNIWRLKNIGKDGPIDKRLESEGIRNVQDFLKLNTIDPERLKAVRTRVVHMILLHIQIFRHGELYIHPCMLLNSTHCYVRSSARRHVR